MIQHEYELIRSIAHADESLDPAAFVALLTPDATFRIGSAPAIKGRAAIEASVRSVFARLESLHHEIGQIWCFSDTVIYEAAVRYHLKDGRELTLPYANVLRLQSALVYDYRIYIDLSPL